MLEACPTIWEALHGILDTVRWPFTTSDFPLELRLDVIDSPQLLRALEKLHGGDLTPAQLWEASGRMALATRRSSS